MNSHTPSTPRDLSETSKHNIEFGSTPLPSNFHLQSSLSHQIELNQSTKRKVEEQESTHRSKRSKRSDNDANALGPLINFLRPITNSFVGSFTDSINTIANFLLPPRTYKRDPGVARNSSNNKDFVFPMQRSDIPVVKHKYKSKKKKSEEPRPTLNTTSSKDLLFEQLQRDQDIQSNSNSDTVMVTTTPNKSTSHGFQSPGLSPINGTQSAESEMNGAWSKFLKDKSIQPSPESKSQPKVEKEYAVRSSWKNQLTTSVRSTKQHNKRNSLDSYFDVSLDLSDYSQSNIHNNNNNASRTMDIDYERTVEQERQRLVKERSTISETLGKGKSKDSAIDLTDDSIIFPSERRRRANSTSALIASQIQILLEQSNHRKQIAAQESVDREQRINQSLNSLRTAAAEKLKQDQAIINQIKRRAQADQGVKKLTEEEEKIVELALDGDDDEVLAEGFNMKVTRGDICRLRTPEWLNDEVINFYMNVVMDRNSKDPSLPKVFVFNTFFFPMLLDKGYERVKKWTRKVDIFCLNYVIIPVHLGVHWCLSVINFVDKRFEYYDSMGSPNKTALKAMRNYLIQEYKDKKKQQFDLTGWSDYMPRDIPQQQNGYDCGVFMCRYADCISQNKPFNFKQKDMITIRKRMILDILSKTYSG